jgi:carbonic anhydrase/acetyltransferase-like protein (isoleucine patch superfamily)
MRAPRMLPRAVPVGHLLAIGRRSGYQMGQCKAEGCDMAIFEVAGYAPQFPESGNYWVAGNAQVMGNVIFHENASVWYGSTVRGDHSASITIGENSNIQDGSVCHVDEGCPLTIGKNVTIGHMVMLHGCTIGEETLIGIGSTILNNAQIGKNCIIGAHSLIPEGKIIPDNSLVMGAPGKIVKELTEQQTALIKMSALHYVENWKKHKTTLKQID